MIKKRIDITINQGRSVTAFFNRVLETFERKFDGFPALPADPSQVPALQENSDAFDPFNSRDIIDAIANSYQDNFTPPCPDFPVDEDCYSVLDEEEVTMVDEFNRVINSSINPFDLGTSTTGYTWTGTGTGLSGADGAVAFVEGGSTIQKITYSAPDPWDAPCIILSTKFRLIGALSSAIFYLRPDAGQFGSINVLMDNVSGGFQIDGTLIDVYSKTDWIPNQWYFAELVRSSISETMSLTIWRETDNKPSPQISLSTSSATLAGADITLGMHASGGQRLECDYVKVAASNCVECEEPVSDTVLKGSLIKQPDGISYTTPTAAKYISDVWYDDLLAVKDIDYTVSASGTVQSTSVMDEDTVVKARYIAL